MRETARRITAGAFGFAIAGISAGCSLALMFALINSNAWNAQMHEVSTRHRAQIDARLDRMERHDTQALGVLNKIERQEDARPRETSRERPQP